MNSSRWISAPDVAVQQWHVGPGVDIAAYALSWLWVLVPLMFVGDTRADYMAGFIAILVLTDLHRHFGLPYVYLDAQIRRRFPVRFFVLPAVMLGLWAASPYFKRLGPSFAVLDVVGLAALVVALAQLLRRDGQGDRPPWRALAAIGLPGIVLAVMPLAGETGVERGWIWLAIAVLSSRLLVSVWPQPGTRRHGTTVTLGVIAIAMVVATNYPALRIHPRDLIAGIVVFTGAWNIWHVLMQKYGILRLYSAKSGRDTKVPGWVDRLLLLAWIPVFLLWLGPANREAVLGAYRQGRGTLVPVLDAMEAAQPYLLAPAIALVLSALALFLWHEWRANRFTNAPRLWLAAGTTSLSAAFFVVHPLKVYLAYGFSHAIEYMVFVWAFQRRRYAKPLAHNPTLARVLKHPWIAYGGFTGGGALLIIALQYGPQWMPPSARPYFLGFSTAEWFVYWGLYQSMVHFYFDSFMWKMRRGTTRAHI
ncbi:MAG: hypothetical protein JKY37_33705 [Nannocystaceae bacterium]|nr:hypothetical protein [Nannocystaceae bacterium]